MYSSKECQSKCIRNTVSSLLVLARDLRTSASFCVWRQKECGPFYQLARPTQCQAGPTLSPLPFPPFACWPGLPTRLNQALCLLWHLKLMWRLWHPWELSRSCCCLRWAVCSHSVRKKQKMLGMEEEVSDNWLGPAGPSTVSGPFPLAVQCVC